MKTIYTPNKFASTERGDLPDLIIKQAHFDSVYPTEQIYRKGILVWYEPRGLCYILEGGVLYYITFNSAGKNVPIVDLIIEDDKITIQESDQRA